MQKSDTCPTDTLRSETEKEVESIHAVDYLAISEQQLSEIKQDTAKDPTLQTLKKVILRGWPEKSSSVRKEVSEYFSVRDEPAVQAGIIFKGQRCVIPKTLRQKLKEKIHRANIGIQGCLRRAREVVYWPSMNQEITDYIEHCDTYNLMFTALSMYATYICFSSWSKRSELRKVGEEDKVKLLDMCSASEANKELIHHKVRVSDKQTYVRDFQFLTFYQFCFLYWQASYLKHKEAFVLAIC